MSIEFTSTVPSREIAEYLATLIYPGVPVDNDVPFRGYSDEWWELSRANDHKLDELGPNRFRYRDRYSPAARMARIEAALVAFGATDIKAL